MATSTPPDEPAAPAESGSTATGPAPREAAVDTVAAQAEAIDEIVDLAQLRLCIFDNDLSQGGWNTVQRAGKLSSFLRRYRGARVELIVHDTRYLEASCPRLLALQKLHAAAMTIYRTGPEARRAMDPLVIADGRHMLHRFHIDQPRAALAIEMPATVRPWLMRFEEIWATGEPGLNASVLGL